ncbi:membrane-associated tyrosine- and threonine-specific cdc2-inhibitory kinase [Pycnococcus provasolii]
MEVDDELTLRSRDVCTPSPVLEASAATRRDPSSHGKADSWKPSPLSVLVSPTNTTDTTLTETETPTAAAVTENTPTYGASRSFQGAFHEPYEVCGLQVGPRQYGQVGLSPLAVSDTTMLGRSDEYEDEMPSTPLRSPEHCETPKLPTGAPTPMSAHGGHSPWFAGPPPTPVPSKRAAPRVDRTDSLNETKVLVALQRTESVVNPQLFRYENHFVFVQQLGATQTSEVWHVKQKSDGSDWALKKSRHDFRGKADRERLVAEIKSVANLPVHPHIIRYKRAWQQDSHLYTQMELANNGTLTLLIDRNGGRLFEQALWLVLGEMSSALELLSQHGVQHLDIKPDNIFVDTTGHCKLGDFGSALRSATSSASWEEGDGRYVSPELLDESAPPSTASDVFSLGASLYHAAYGRPLERDWMVPREDWLNASLDALAATGHVTADFMSVLRAMLRRTPEQRPTPLELRILAAKAVSMA